jgi:hypothetical protein
MNQTFFRRAQWFSGSDVPDCDFRVLLAHDAYGCLRRSVTVWTWTVCDFGRNIDALFDALFYPHNLSRLTFFATHNALHSLNWNFVIVTLKSLLTFSVLSNDR